MTATIIQAVVASCKQEKVQAQQKYQATVEQLKKEHETALSKLSNQQEIQGRKVCPQEPPVRRQNAVG